MSATLIERDLKHIWHPCSQMKDYETFLPLPVVSAAGSHLMLSDGRKIIDGISSWWCKSLGHQHPRLMAALSKQMQQFEHVILANTTNPTIVELSECLAGLTKTLKKVSYASDGSCAVEMALKMSLHARVVAGETKRSHFVSLQNAYHGETLGALSVSDLGLYKAPYTALLFQSTLLTNIPYVQNEQDPLWEDCSEHWSQIEKQLEKLSAITTAVIIEPIVQGAAGMKIYSKDFLKRLRAWTKAHDIHLIADEIMTGMGRTGKMLACEHAHVEPDFLCLSKGLTSGCLPLSAMLTTQGIYDLFYDDYASGKSFLHSHTYSGNALAASVAVEVLKIMAEEDMCARAIAIGQQMHLSMLEIAEKSKKLTNVRSIGALVAADLVGFESGRRIGFEFYQRAVAQGVLLRPLGNTIYWLPPLTTDAEMLLELKRITERVLVGLSSRA